MIRYLRYALVCTALVCMPAMAMAQDASTTAPIAAEVAAPVPTEATAPAPADAAAPTPADAAAPAPVVTPETPSVVTETPAPSAAASVQASASLDSNGRVSPPPAGKGQIVFFRPSKWMGGGVAFTITENGADVAKLTNGTYYVYVADPGAHTYQVKSEATDTFDVEVDEGETYYVKEIMSEGVLLYRPNLTPSDQATFEALPKLKLAKAPKPKVKS